VFDALGAKTYVINAEPDGYNINMDCGSTHIEHLQQLVLEKKLDVGFAFDGDADRCLAVDENGHLVDGDLILYVCGRYLHKYGRLVKDTVVPTVMSNFGLYKAFDELGIKYRTTDVGDKYVHACMRKHGYILGGEQSGHIIFGELETTGDGIMTSLRLMEAARAEREPLSVLTRPVKLYPQRLDNVRVTDKDAAMNAPAVLEASQKADEFLGGNGRVLVRASGTEPLVRVLAEAPEDELCREANRIVLEALKPHLA
jgi:phosphoglucosamine mutase